MKNRIKKVATIVTAILLCVCCSVPMAFASGTHCGNEYVVSVSSPYCEGRGCGGKQTVMTSYQDYTYEQICVENKTTFTRGRTTRKSNGCC